MSLTFPVKMKNTGAFKDHSKSLGYFEEQIWQYHHGQEPCILLPYLLELSEDLGYSTLDIQCALIELRKKGYDYFMMDIHGPITVWYPPKVNSYQMEKPAG
jgi:hypothetical protein